VAAFPDLVVPELPAGQRLLLPPLQLPTKLKTAPSVLRCWDRAAGAGDT